MIDIHRDSNSNFYSQVYYNILYELFINIGYFVNYFQP